MPEPTDVAALMPDELPLDATEDEEEEEIEEGTDEADEADEGMAPLPDDEEPDKP